MDQHGNQIIQAAPNSLILIFQFYEFKADFLLSDEQTLSSLLLQCNLC